MIGETLPAGYRFDVDADAVASVVLGKSTWAVLALTLDIELFSQLHYRQSIAPDDQLSELFKNVFLYHWKEESQHAILDELEWFRHDATLTDNERDKAVGEFIELIAASELRPSSRRSRDPVSRNEFPRGLPVAIHPLGCPSSPFRRGAS
jgi:hypothetical protein